MPSKVKPGPISTLAIFGGGQLVVDFAKAARKMGIGVRVFCVNRHLKEKLENGYTLEQALRKEGISLSACADINNFSGLKPVLKGKALGIGIGEAYTFNAGTLKLFNGNIFDFMTIDLPRYRGGAHFTWQILKQEKQGCWNIQRVNGKMFPGVFDSGEVIKKIRYDLPSGSRIPRDYFKAANKEGLKLFIEFITDAQKGRSFDLRPIDESKSMYLPRLHTASQAFIDWRWSAEEIERFVCAFDEPYRGASTFIGSKRYFLKNCSRDKSFGASHPFISGIIYRTSKNAVYTAAKDGGLIFAKVSDVKEKDALRSLKTGERFYTPLKHLEDAMLFKADYNSEGLAGKNKDK